jgi:acyl-CoA thioesterase I
VFRRKCWYDFPVNPVLLYFASGESLYSGAVLLILTAAISPFLKYRLLLRMRNVAAWLALVLIVMACPPFAWIVDAIFVAVFLLWFTARNTEAPGRRWATLRAPATAALLVLLLVLPAVEFSHRRMPVIKGEANGHLVVIGDSISSGLGTRVAPWPAVMQQMTKVDVKNFSRPGATVADGVAEAEEVSADDRLILIELGGNDLIAGEPSEEFARALEDVLAKLASPGRTIVMFELPLLPNRIAYGRIQRRLVAKYRVTLIPKRFFAAIIAGPEATSDGLHLTDEGARRMASLVVQVLSPVLKLQSVPTSHATHP